MATLSCAATDLAGRTGGTFAKPPKGRLLSMGLLDCYVAKLVSFSGALGTAFSTDWSEVGAPARHFPRRIVSIAPQKRRTQSHASSKRYSKFERIMARYPRWGAKPERACYHAFYITYGPGPPRRTDSSKGLFDPCGLLQMETIG